MSNLSGLCPNCGSKLVYGDEDKSVMCYACDSLINVGDLASGKSTASASVGGAIGVAAASMMGFDNPDSGVVFIENFFETYAWKEYQMDAEIDIPEISGVISNNKMKNGAVAASWYLDYKGLAVPVRKKIEGLTVIAEKIGAAYNPDDLTEAYESYDLYVNVSKRLMEEKDGIFSRLENAIKYAEKFKLDKAKLTEIKTDIEELKAMYDRDVCVVNDISELPAYLAAQAALNTEKSRELAIRGIDAKAAYEEALQIYNSENPDKSGALVLFERVRGYGESVKLINNINQFYNFEGELYRFFGKYFIFKNESYLATLNVKDLGKKKSKKEQEAEAQQQAAAPKALSLYGVEDGEPSKAPIVTGIAQMITCYGGKIYYFKLNQGIYSYNVYNNTETLIDAGKTADYMLSDGEKVGYQYALVNNGKAFLVKKRSVKEMKPVEGGKKGQMVEVADVTLNPESIIVVDMVNEIAKKTIPAMQKVVFPEMTKEGRKVLNLTSRIFYTFVEKSIPVQAKGCGSKKKEPVVELKTKFMVCNLATGECKSVLDENCEICTVFKDKIVYALHKPNKYNKDILVVDMATGESNVVESNVYQYFDVIDGKVYYLVGNDEYCPLVRNSFAGDCREEIMQNVEKILCDIGGWLYVRKGKGFNSLLVKVSADGKKRVVLCSQLKKFIGFYGNLIYYKDYSDTLRSVRIDGKNNISVAKNIDEVYPMEKSLFYTRKEKVGGAKEALSIYKMDKDGRNVRKVVFNVDKVGSDELTSKLYFKKDETARFKVYEPKKEKEAVLIDYPLQRYYEMDMNTEDVQLVLTVGLPHSEEVKAGCGGKKTKFDKIYEEVAWTPNYD
ncbi:MAG: DUF5050 domain-containing protein [Clostridia bacterium]|nr:DUF5050 domain-containing protein [Clostridia bacterium]